MPRPPLPTPGTNSRLCYLNTKPDEVIRSLFYNKYNESLITVSVHASDNYSSLQATAPPLPSLCSPSPSPENTPPPASKRMPTASPSSAGPPGLSTSGGGARRRAPPCWCPSA